MSLSRVQAARDAELGLTGTNLWLYPDAKHDANIARFLADPSAPLPLVYASFPSAKDPSFQERFPGRATIDLITLCPWDWVERWKDTSWMKRGAEYEELKATLHRTAPRGALRGAAAAARQGRSCRALDASDDAPLRGSSARRALWARSHRRRGIACRLRAQTPVQGLFLTGADLVSAGVAGGLVGGVMTSAAILGVRVLGDA